MKKDLEKERETTKFIHREPVVGRIKFPYMNYSQAVTMDIELKHKDHPSKGTDLKTYENPLELSISNGIWNKSHTDITEGGQGHDTLREALQKGYFTPTGLTRQEFKKLLDVWDKYHLNDLKAGTIKQNKFVDEYLENHKDERYDYTKMKNLLKENGLEPDNGYEYGSAWFYEPLPEDVIKFVREIQEKLNINENGKPKE